MGQKDAQEEIRRQSECQSYHDVPLSYAPGRSCEAVRTLVQDGSR